MNDAAGAEAIQGPANLKLLFHSMLMLAGLIHRAHRDSVV
jgi:hypothetical protein